MKNAGKIDYFLHCFLLFRTCHLLGHGLLDMYELNETFNLTETDEYFVCNKGVYCVCSMLVARYTLNSNFINQLWAPDASQTENNNHQPNELKEENYQNSIHKYIKLSDAMPWYARYACGET